jgi:hypothetical protein
MDLLTIKTTIAYKNEKEYIYDVVFHQFLGINYRVKWTESNVSHYQLEYLNADVSFPEILFSTPGELWLTHKAFPELPLRCFESEKDLFEKKVPILFGAKKPQENLMSTDIDILGSIFFLLTRYEEIDSKDTDLFGRFHHEASLLYKENLLRRPLVNEYLEILKEEIIKIAPSVTFKKHTYTFSLSHDVDVPLTFQNPFTDYLKKSFGDLYFRKSPELLIRRMMGKMKYVLKDSFAGDPNNNFDFIMDEADKVGVKSLFNFIPVMGASPLDSHYDINHPFITRLFKTIAKRGFEIGFHPSFDSFESLNQTKKELDILNEALTRINLHSVKRGRQHYLRWTNPKTWQIWEEIGLEEDSSVGFGMINGFRAGCAYKYKVFNLETRKTLNLIEEPLIVMDVNSDANSDPETVFKEVSYFSEVCHFFNGNFTLLYHNNYVLTKTQKFWYSEILKTAT